MIIFGNVNQSTALLLEFYLIMMSDFEVHNVHLLFARTAETVILYCSNNDGQVDFTAVYNCVHNQNRRGTDNLRSQRHSNSKYTE